MHLNWLEHLCADADLSKKLSRPTLQDSQGAESGASVGDPAPKSTGTSRTAHHQSPNAGHQRQRKTNRPAILAGTDWPRITCRLSRLQTVWPGKPSPGDQTALAPRPLPHLPHGMLSQEPGAAQSPFELGQWTRGGGVGEG